MINPIYFKQRKGMNPLIRIEYIVAEYYDENDPIYRKISEYCTLMNITFGVRLFDSQRYSEDRDCIERLPAIQIYEKHEYLCTSYPENKIINVIREAYEKSELEILEYMAKRQIWDEKLKYLKRIFKKFISKTDSLVSSGASNNTSHSNQNVN